MTTDIGASGRPNVLEADLPTLRFTHLTDPEEAHRVIAEASRQSAIAHGVYGPEFLSYELVRAVLRDDRFVVVEGLGLAAEGITSGPLWDRVSRFLISIDGDVHRQLRQLVAKTFSPRGVARLQTFIADVINEIVDPVAAKGQCDVVADISASYPTPVICEIVGAPRHDWQLFADWTDQIVKVFEGNLGNDGPAVLATWDEFDAYIEAMIAERRRSPTDDLISELVVAEDSGHISHRDLLVLIVMLLGAGTDTTRHSVAAAAQLMCDRPDQWALLAQHPELASTAADEFQRYYPVFFATNRVATEDVEIGGVTVPAGTVVTANLAAANRDPAVYDEPHRLDITRKLPMPMMSFGGGPHNCLGTHVARLELTQALRLLPRRLPNMRRVGPPPSWKQFAGITGPTSMHIEFEPGH